MTISYDDYISFLKPDSIVKVFLKGTVLETKRSCAKVDTFQILKPGIEVKVGLSLFHMKWMKLI